MKKKAKKIKSAVNLYAGSIFASWLLLALVLASEMSEPFKTFLKDVFGHHWIGKGVIIAAAFFAFGYFMKNKKYSYEKAAWYSVVACLVLIFLFFAASFFG